MKEYYKENIEKAIELWKKALQMDPELSEAKAALQKAEKLLKGRKAQ